MVSLWKVKAHLNWEGKGWEVTENVSTIGSDTTTQTGE